MISSQKSSKHQPSLIPENIYGHSKRLDWIISNLNKGNTIIELGCGTGSMITIPLAVLGYQIIGVDMDENSIAFGRQLLHAHGLSSTILERKDMRDIPLRPDVLIASEVLEHLCDGELQKVLSLTNAKLADNGVLLVTVPNGFGWFEMESFLWFKTGVGWLLERTRVAEAIIWIKSALFHCDPGESYPPSTLAESPHVQRFTYKSIQRVLIEHGFEVLSVRGSVLLAGPFSNLFFTGIVPIMKINRLLGQCMPRLAAGFYVTCRPTRRSLS